MPGGAAAEHSYPKSFCILPCPKRGGGCVGIVFRHQGCACERVPSTIRIGLSLLYRTPCSLDAIGTAGSRTQTCGWNRCPQWECTDSVEECRSCKNSFMPSELFLHDPDFRLFKMPVEGIDLTNPQPFHDEYGKSIVNADSALLGEPDTFPVILC